ncbi:MAG: MMPL family transporter [Candidatus Methylacidiphilales bacterium]
MFGIHRFLQRMLLGLARIIYAQPLLILIASVLLTVVCGYVGIANYKVLNNTSQLLDSNSKFNKTYQEMEKDFGGDVVYLVLIQGDKPELNRTAALEVGAFLESLKPYIGTVTCRLDYSRLKERPLFFLSVDELEKIQQQTAFLSKIDFNFNSLLSFTNARFADPELRESDNWKQFKPLVDKFEPMLNFMADRLEGKADARFPALALMAQDDAPKPAASGTAESGSGTEAASGQPSFSIADGQATLDAEMARNEFVTFQDGKALLITATRGKMEDMGHSPSTETVRKIRAFLIEMEAKYPGMKLGLTGEPVLGDDEMSTTNDSVVKASVITSVLICLLFLLSYRNLERPIYAGLVLGMGMALSMAFTMTVIGHFNVISQAIIPMVLGLGIDFGIQIMGRYEEELAEGKSVEYALNQALGHTGVAVVTGGSTTAIAFLTICFNEFLGLRELGAIAGASVILCMIANLVTLPAIFVLRDRNRTKEALMAQAGSSNWGFLAPMDKLLVSQPWPVLIISGIITVLSIYGIFHVKFDYNLLHLQNPKLESVRVLHELFKASGNSTLFCSVVAKDMAEARDYYEKLKVLPSVQMVEDRALRTIPEGQDEKLPIIKSILEPLQKVPTTGDFPRVDAVAFRKDINQLLENFTSGARDARDLSSTSNKAKAIADLFDKLIVATGRVKKAADSLSDAEVSARLTPAQVEVFGAIREKVAWLKTMKYDRGIAIEDLPETVRKTFFGPNGKVRLLIYAKKDVWDWEPNHAFVNELRTVAPDVTGTPVMNYEYIDLLRLSFVHAAVWAFVAIVVLISLHFQNWKYIVLAIAPLVLAVIWRTGLMIVLNIEFNPANVVTLPLIIGIDVAYGVYIVDRFREDGCVSMFSSSTGKAIILTGLTSLFGFVSLLVSTYIGMYSIGLLMSLGIAIGMITTIIVLPQALELLNRNKALPK